MRHSPALHLFILLLIAVAPLFADEVEERRLWAEEYIQKPKAPARTKPVKKPEYKVATPQIVTETVTPETVVGVTIWRLRTAKSEEVPQFGDSERLVAERVEGSTTLFQGDRVRLSIEAASDGYLYVINREQYADGTTGDPYLIFPTTRLTAGNNRTTIGRVIEIPSQSDRPPYFTLTPGRPDQVAELISVFITPQPLSEIRIGDQPLTLTSAQVSDWENRSGGNATGRLELVNGAGLSWSEAEKEAGDGTRLLKHTDPSP